MTRLLEDGMAVVTKRAVPLGCRCWPFAREGAQAFLTGRRLAPLERVVTEIKQAGGAARIAQVDTLDEAATERHRDQMVEEFRGVMSPSLPFTESKTV